MLRLTPLGDSLTEDITYGFSYQKGLWNRLAATGFTTSSLAFVGSQTRSGAATPWTHHEGHGGYRLDQLAAPIVAWLMPTQPHVVTLLAGINEFGWAQGQTAPDDLATLVDRIHTVCPKTLVLVSTLPPSKSPGALDIGRPWFNAQIPDVLAPRQAAGRPIEIVDAANLMDKTDVSADGVHLLDTGYDKLAGLWYDALVPWLPYLVTLP